MRPIVVQTVRCTSLAAPTQWHGRTTDNRPIYARFRHDTLSVRLGPPGGTSTDAVNGETVGEWMGESGSVLYYDELRTLTRGVITWPETDGDEEVEDDEDDA